MKSLIDRIFKDGYCVDGGILRVDRFINEQMDPRLMKQVAVEFFSRFARSGVNKIMTVEASGIAPAVMLGYMMELPVVFAKKHKTSNVDGNVYSSTVHSFTHGMDYQAQVSTDYLTKEDTVLLVDDFLANGNALRGLVDLCGQAGAKVAGAAIAIEKCFQGGGDELRAQGIRVESLACIEAMTDTDIVFRR